MITSEVHGDKERDGEQWLMTVVKNLCVSVHILIANNVISNKKGLRSVQQLSLSS